MDRELTRRAERAVLGAMITDQQLAARLEVLEPRDFTDPRHRAVFTTIRALAGTAPLGLDGWRDAIAMAGGGPARRGYLDGLAASCPAPAHGPAYAALLVQASLYRIARDRADQIDACAALLGYEASRAGEVGSPAGVQASGIGAHLAEVAKAIRGHTAMLAPGAPAPDGSADEPAATADSLRDQLAQAAWPFAGPVPDTPPASARPAQPAPVSPGEQREELILSALLQRHPQSGQILSFLPAAAFTDPARQEIYRAVHRLNQAGHPVDEVTVAWDLATRAATVAVLSPRARPSQVPDGYLAALAHAVTGSQSPLRAAHELEAQLRRRNAGRRQAATLPRPAVATRQPDPALAVQPPPPAQAARPGPQQRM